MAVLVAVATATAAMVGAVARAALARVGATEGAGAMVAATKAALDPVMAAAMAAGAEWMKMMTFRRQLAPGVALAESWGALRVLKTALRPAAARS